MKISQETLTVISFALGSYAGAAQNDTALEDSVKANEEIIELQADTRYIPLTEDDQRIIMKALNRHIHSLEKAELYDQSDEARAVQTKLRETS